MGHFNFETINKLEREYVRIECENIRKLRLIFNGKNSLKAKGVNKRV